MNSLKLSVNDANVSNNGGEASRPANPDSNFITRLPNTGYMVEEDLNNRVTSFGDKTNFSIIHFNTRSLIRNFDQLNLLLRNLNMPFSVIGVSETWLTDCTAEHVNIVNRKQAAELEFIYNTALNTNFSKNANFQIQM